MGPGWLRFQRFSQKSMKIAKINENLAKILEVRCENLRGPMGEVQEGREE